MAAVGGASSGGQRFSVVIVGNIPYQTTEDDIGHYFSQAGQVMNVRIVYDRETGRPKGFGFCEFSDETGAQNAVNQLNGTDFNGRALRVNWANKN
uniref:RRM domain-containing protein n=1 Tax=Heterorhabditis bacteriophora TaxID=37862 RepID=A0A1I7XHY3_HETBA